MTARTGVAALFLFAVSASAFAQTPAPSFPAPEPERASFYLLRGADTVIIERSARTPSELTGEFLDKARGARLAYVAAITPERTIDKLAVHSYRSATDSVGEIAVFELDADQMRATVGRDGPVPLPSVEGALPVLNPSVAFIEQMVMRAKTLSKEPSVTVPVFLIGTQNSSTASVNFRGDSAVIIYANVIMRVAISSTGQVLGGVVPSQQVTIVRGPAGPPLVLRKPSRTAVFPLKTENDAPKKRASRDAIP